MRSNPSDDETGIFWDIEVNTTAADARVPYVRRSSTTKVYAVHDKQVLGFHEEGFKLPVPSHIVDKW